MCITGKPALVCHVNAPAVSTCLTVVESSCIVESSGGTPVVRSNEAYRHEGQPCTRKEELVENTLRVKHEQGLYCGLWGLQRNRECYDSAGRVCGTWAEL